MPDQETRRARILFDSSVSPSPFGFRGAFNDRHLLFVDEDIDIHLKISARRNNKEVYGQVIPRGTGGDSGSPTVTLFVGDKPTEKTKAAHFGEFAFRELPAGTLAIEVLIPNCRVIVCFSL